VRAARGGARARRSPAADHLRRSASGGRGRTSAPPRRVSSCPTAERSARRSRRRRTAGSRGADRLANGQRQAGNWFNERLEIQSIADDITSKYVPPHVNIFYCLGGITLTCFLVQVATGFAMTFYYRPTVTDAFSSVQYIMTDVNFGWLIRSVHRWSASMMVLINDFTRFPCLSNRWI
jgi:hypothetical protein